MKRLFLSGLCGFVLLAGCQSEQTEVTIDNTTSEPIPAQPAAAVAAASGREALVQEIDKKLDAPKVAKAHFGVEVMSLDTGEVWYERNSHRMFMPASNEKILTASAALLFLGPDFHYETLVCNSGTVSGNTLNGDLVVFGNGDPTIYNRFFKDARDPFRDWAKQLKEKGITHITGRVIGDDNAWGDSHVGSSWPHEDMVEWYYAEFGPLSFNENYVDIKVVPPATADGKVEFAPNVPSSYYHLVDDIKVAAGANNRVSLNRPWFSNEITLSGSVAPGAKSFEKTATITNPTLWYVTALKETLQEQGITIDGAAADCDDVQGYSLKRGDLPVLINHQSPALSEIIQGLMKRSQNMSAETMIYTVGWKATGKGTFAAGKKQIQESLKTLGVDPDEYSYSDGSGLSRYNYISPDLVCRIYKNMLGTQYKDAWFAAQSIAGVDGTLRNRMKGTPAENNMRGKTGHISSVASLSGYVKTAAGEQLVFSFLCNGQIGDDADVDSTYNELAAMLAGYPGAAQ